MRWSLAIVLFCSSSLIAQTGSPSLRDRIEAEIAPLGDQVTIEVAFHDLQTGETCQIRSDEPIHPASTMKVPVMLEVFRRAKAGLLSLDDRLPIKNSFASIVDGSPYTLDEKDDSEQKLYKRVGESATIRELTFLMITESSNLATNLLVEKVTPDATTAFMRELKADGLKVLRGVEDSKAFAKGLNNVGTAHGLETVLTRIADGSAVSKKASAEMRTILLAQKFREGIPAGLPPEAKVAHKTGSITAAYHDAAIVEIPGRKPFVLVVMTRGIADEPKSHQLVARIARLTYEHVAGK